ncbi:hypothetical protein Tco_1178856, partial [Tanacetum coccineum]
LKLSKSQGASTPAEVKHMQNVPYASVVGSIMYAMRCTRRDVAFAQNITSWFQQNPGELHWTVVKNILKYLCNTKDMFLVYGGAVDWKSTKQSIFAISSIEDEYIATSDAFKEAVWVRKFIVGLGVVQSTELHKYGDEREQMQIGSNRFRQTTDIRFKQIAADSDRQQQMQTDLFSNRQTYSGRQFLITPRSIREKVAGNQSNGSTGTKACDNAGKARMETIPGKDYILLPLSIQDPPFSSSSKDSPDAGFKPSGEEEKKDAEDPGNKSRNPTEGKDSEVPSTKEPRINQENDDNINSTNNINTASDGNSTNNVNVVSSTVNAAGSEVNVVDPKTSIKLLNDPNMPELKDIVYSDDDEDVGAEADINNLDTHIPVSPIPTTRIHKDHPVKQIIGDIYSAP